MAASVVVVLTGLMAVVLAFIQLYPVLLYGFKDEDAVPDHAKRFPRARVLQPKNFWMHVLFLSVWFAIGVYFVGYGAGVFPEINLDFATPQ